MTHKPVLVVEHEAMCPPAWFGEWLSRSGVVIDVRRPYAGDSLPDRLDGHRSLLVLGGSMDAYSDAAYPWLTAVKDLFRQADSEGVPALGICLGHQLASVALGGEVQPNPHGQQIGILEVGWSDQARGDALFGSLRGPGRAVQWNNDVVAGLPPGTAVLARAASGELQAARFAPTVWGVQWHPEAHAAVVRAWADLDRDAVHERGLDVDDYVADVRAAEQELWETWRPLAEAFAALDREVVATW